ncbi:MAG: DUF2214 family protein [Pseudomonadota bacterium]|nr:DUF2214 family protein [Pseudomonadota bacterium]
MWEAWLAFFHLSAFLGWVVFASPQAALCRVEWINPAVVRRVARLVMIEAHVLALVPLAAVFMARGWGV